MEWCEDEDTARAAELLYGHISNMELYPGLQAGKSFTTLTSPKLLVFKILLTASHNCRMYKTTYPGKWSMPWTNNGSWDIG